jgi:hypothetical protein
MADDVETTLEGLERRLRALQAELDEPESVGTVTPQTVGTAFSQPVTVPSQPGTVPVRPPVPSDPLEAFGSDLRRLVASFDRMLSELRGPPTAAGYVFTGDVAIDAAVSFDGLCALGRALGDVGGVHSVDLRAYAGGRAALDVVLERPVALVEELRGRIRTPLSLVEAREGRLVLDVG